jgi:hemin uptake protein HemP
MPTPPAVPKPTSVPRIGASDIMQGGREVIIQHGAAEYRLRITSTGKLILTK